MTNEKADIYTRITNRIIAELEKGTRPWLKPWNAEHTAGRITRPLRHNGIPYRGINVLTLWLTAVDRGYSCPSWLTFKQAQELGAHVRKGERGETVVFASRITRTETTDRGEETERDIPFLKSYAVFNAEQIDGLPDQFYVKPERPQGSFDHLKMLENVEAFIKHTAVEVRHGGNRAFYSPTYDFIQMPPLEAFRDTEAYYNTKLHELTHATRHETRLNRDFGRKRWGDEGYAAEELVAELGSAFLCADLGITPEPCPDHASYLESWLQVLKNDKRAIFTAAAHAERATAFLHGLQPDARTAANDDDEREAAA
jgi:antirestriction protein ArdC